MSDEQDGSANRWVEEMREGKSPQDFIIAQVHNLRQAVERQQRAEGTDVIPIGNGDVAYLVQFWIDQGVIGPRDVSDTTFLTTLGLTEAEAQDFIPKTLPEIQEFMRQERQKELEVAQVKQREAALLFTKEWGLERLDQVAAYYQKHQTALIRTNLNWGSSISRFKNQRVKLQTDLEGIIDPLDKARFLMRQAYYLTFFHPSELERVFRAEQEHNAYPYLDSLMNASVTMFANTSGKDPDFANVHISTGSMSMTVSWFSIDDPESMKQMRRSQAMEGLIFGAKTPNETSGLMKKQFRPFQRRQEYGPPDTVR